MKQPNFGIFFSAKSLTGLAFGRFGKILLAAGFIACALPTVCQTPASAQLPPVNMGKYVHQPGDNQYSSQTQQSRHGAPAPVMQAIPQQQVQVIQNQEPVWRPTPRPNRPDPSVLPIVCDEPIPPAGFPPLPEQIDIVGMSFTGSAVPLIGGAGGGGMGGGGGNFSSSYQGSAPGLGAPEPPQVRQSQGYTNVTPGMFVQRKSVYGGGNNSGPTGKGSRDFYASGDGAAPKPAMSGSEAELSRMGREPSLGKSASAAPEAPAAVEINQATTQDLSLPDDQTPSNTQKRSNSQAGRMARQMGRQMTRQLYRGMNGLVRFPR